jgi:tryptophan-rich sensory protein
MRIPIEGATSYRGRNSRPNFPALVIFVGLAFAVGALGAVFSPGVSAQAARWYSMLSKPGWLPPQSWFGPVWAALYLLMGIAAWIIWRERFHRGRNAAIAAYAIQLLLNALWAPLFFGLKSIDAGLFDIVVVWVAIGWTIREFARVRAVAAWILAPYLMWVTVAVAMNLEIWKLNP